MSVKPNNKRHLFPRAAFSKALIDLNQATILEKCRKDFLFFCMYFKLNQGGKNAR